MERRAGKSHQPFDGRRRLRHCFCGGGQRKNRNVIVERIIKLLTEEGNSAESAKQPMAADKIVLVTFTRKAAAEMKERLERALRSCPDSALIRKQLIRLEEAHITTINAFCLNLLRENSAFTDLEEGFTVADEEELEILAKKAMSATLEQFYDLDVGEIEQTCAFFGSGGDSALQRAVWDLHAFTRNIPDAEEWLDEQLRRYDNPQAYYDEIVPRERELLDKDIAKATKNIGQSMEIAEFDTTLKSLREELDFFTGASCLYPARRTSHKDEAPEVKEQIKAGRAVTKKIADDVLAVEVLVGDFVNAVTRLAPIVRTLIKTTRLYAEKFAEVKRVNRVVDFADCEHMCLEVLRGGNFESDHELIIVDEFQDSNFLQYELFKLLDAGRGRLYMVGDIKQSIYRFRGADSAVFEQVAGDSRYEVMHLSRNFRSSDQVIDAVNDIFEAIMPNYDEDSRLKAGRGVSKPEFVTEFALLDSESFSDTELTGAEAEAEYTARRIKQMIAGSQTSSPEALRFGDFAVLSSTGERNFKVYEAVFRRHGIPCVSAGGGGYLKTEEVGLALDLLMVINNPYNDLSLFNIMLSPLYAFTAEEIAAIRAGNRDVPLYSAVLAAGDVPKTQMFLDTISRYRKIADVSSVSELIAVINGEGGWSPLLTDSHRRANVRLLSYYAEQFSAARTDCSLSAFLAYMKELKSSGIDVRQANVNVQSAGCVRLMTIHASKGLEFPVCFVARTNQNYFLKGGGESAASRLRFCESAGIVGDYLEEREDSLCRYRTLHGDYAARLRKRQDESEEMRKLYVAATRAEFKLIFTAYTKDGEISENSYASWVSGKVKLVDEIPEDISIEPAISEEVREDSRDSGEVGVYSREVLRTVPRKLTATQIGVSHSELHEHEHDEPTLFPRNPSFYGEGRLTGKKRGDAYHKAMELLDFAAGDYLRQLQSLEPRFTPAEFRAIDSMHILEFFGDDLGRRAVKSGRVVKEFKLYTQIEIQQLMPDIEDLPADAPRPFIQGIADMFFYEDGEIVLVDYKTNRNTSAEKLRCDYGGQLAVYKRAIEEMTGVRVKECWLYSFEKGAIQLSK
jgi:ATP-dependent helicase/nuclease subunit A